MWPLARQESTKSHIFAVPLTKLQKSTPKEFIGPRVHHSHQQVVAHDELDNELWEIDFCRRVDTHM